MQAGNHTPAYVLTLTSPSASTLAWTWTGPNPVFWIVLPCGDDVPFDAIEQYDGADRTDDASGNEGANVWLVGVDASGNVITTPFSNCVFVAG